MKFKLGIDVGGTFTDFILISDTGSTTIHKTLSTPEDPSIGVLSGIHDLAGILNMSLNELIKKIETIVHGTTVATNALLTLGGAKTALITTKGVRDALEMRRGIREEQYNNHYRNVQPLVPRYLRLTVDERIDTEGKILKGIEEADLENVATILKKENVEAISICFMNSFINSAHEEKALSYMKKEFPDTFITASKDVLPSIRFYERVSTTVVNAYIGPVVANYLDNLTTKLDDINFDGTINPLDVENITNRMFYGIEEIVGLFEWKPTFDQAASYPLTFTVSDGNLTDSGVITLTVNDINQAVAS